MNNYYEEEYKVRTDDVDANFEMTVWGLNSAFETVAGRHSAELSASQYDLITKHNKKWVVVKEKLKIYRLPVLNEIIRFVTYPLKATTVKFPRCMRVFDKDGNTLVEVYSEWCVLEKDTDKIVLSKEIFFDIDNYRDDVPDVKFEKIPNVTSGEIVYTRRIRYTDLDSNKHTNNVNYCKMAFDVFRSEDLQGKKLKVCEIDFLSQSFEDDDLDIYKSIAESGYVITGKKSDKDVFKVYLSFE